MKLEVGKSYKSREGTVWNVVGRSQFDEVQPFICENFSGDLEHYSENGLYNSEGSTSYIDLVEEYTPLLEGWVNVYTDNSNSRFYLSAHAAANGQGPNCIRAVKVREVRE
jgi:hypothetical protein